jgi:hypothetical protein
MILNINNNYRYQHMNLPFSPRCLGAGLLILIAACNDDPAGPDTQEEAVDSLTVDASAGWALVRLGDPATSIAAANPASSTDWDIGFIATSVMLNGGEAGPAGVVGHCLCRNANATDAQIIAMDPAAERDRFLAVSTSDVPAAAEAWQIDALDPVIDGWYSYNQTTHAVSAAPEKVWKVKTAGPAYAKFHVTNLADATANHAGRISIEFAVQAGLGAPFAAPQTATIDVSGGGRVYFDFARAGLSDASDWDIAFEGYTIRINGGVSGDGGAGAVLGDETFAAMTDASDAPATVYAGDAFGGVFDEHPWYRYNLQNDHQIYPTFDVYLIRRGDEVFKVQLVSYYGPTGNTRQITFRYARVED